MNIGLITATFLHITMVDYTLYTQGYLKNLFHGVCQDKSFKQFTKAVYYIHIKIILIIIIIIQAWHHTPIQTCHHTLIQELYHTLFVFVHIALLILFMNLMELHLILRLFTYMLPNLSPLDSLPHSSRGISEKRRVRRNQWSNLTKRIRRDARIRRQ